MAGIKVININQMIQLNNLFCVLFKYKKGFWLQYLADSIICDSIKRRALYF